jgi:XapX domain-containing protein
MKVYVVSLAVGVLVGILYALLSVRSPAPPIVALIGLLGMLVGEQIPPVAKHLFTSTQSAAHLWFEQVKPHMFGHLPSGASPSETGALDSVAREARS